MNITKSLLKKLLLIPFIILLLPAIPFFIMVRLIGYPKGFAYSRRIK